MAATIELPQGALDLLILQTLALAPLHGWAVSGRVGVDFETWMKMDMQYIDNWSLALDWKILLRTIPRVLAGRGAN